MVDRREDVKVRRIVDLSRMLQLSAQKRLSEIRLIAGLSQRRIPETGAGPLRLIRENRWSSDAKAV